MNSDGINNLIEEASKAFGVRRPEDNTIDIDLTSTEATYLIALYAEQEEQARLAALAAKERGRITKLLADLCPDGATITVGGEELFSRRIDTTRAINVKTLKAEFPDEPANAEFWTTNIVTKSIWAPKQPGGAA